jgi:hypothetical protein
LVWMTWLWPSLLGLSRVVQPDTILRWHRAEEATQQAPALSKPPHLEDALIRCPG